MKFSLPKANKMPSGAKTSIPYLATSIFSHKGCSPSGIMHTSIISKHCQGFSGCETILIEYDIPSGMQQSYHTNPGHNYIGTFRKAYLPNNRVGQRIATRLQYAWICGLTFTVGTSATTGQTNAVTWSSILHKTALNGGEFGWPDPNFCSRCDKSLDALCVPDADACRPWLAALSGSPAATPDIEKETISYDAPSSLKRDAFSSGGIKPISSGTVSDDTCSICLDPLPYECVAEITKCRHVFHQSCIVESLNQQFMCPICRCSVGDPQGRSPSGSMRIELTQKECTGYAPAKAISITYILPSGTQKAYHNNPGNPYQGTTRTAYLPHNDDGIKLLQRLKYAWKHGLMFTIGTSLSSGESNVVTWTSIHHKTSLQGGAHGFPDANYVENCNESMDSLHVPNACEC